MPQAAPHPCSYPGCPALVRGQSRCERHQPKPFAGVPRSGGYGHAWNRARTQFLREHPWCVHCKDEGSMVAATTVDHIVPHRGNERLFWNRGNWQSLCKPHHDRKTGREAAARPRGGQRDRYR